MKPNHILIERAIKLSAAYHELSWKELIKRPKIKGGAPTICPIRSARAMAVYMLSKHIPMESIHEWFEITRRTAHEYKTEASDKCFYIPAYKATTVQFRYEVFGNLNQQIVSY